MIIILFIALYVSSPFYIILLIIIITVQILIKNVSGFANRTNYKQYTYFVSRVNK